MMRYEKLYISVFSLLYQKKETPLKIAYKHLFSNDILPNICANAITDIYNLVGLAITARVIYALLNGQYYQHLCHNARCGRFGYFRV